jgi:hypothetical protein
MTILDFCKNPSNGGNINYSSVKYSGGITNRENSEINYSVFTGHITETRTIDLSKELSVEEFANFGFKKAADMVLTDSNKIGLKIKYHDYIPSAEFYEHCDGVYLIVIDGKIVKIGGTLTGLAKRWGSYNNGTDKIRKGASNGSCANYYVTTAIKAALNNGHSVEWYYKKLNYEIRTLNIYGIEITENVCVDGGYKIHEKALLTFYKNKTNNYPKLSKNS